MDSRQRQELDRHITGNWGEDQMREMEDEEQAEAWSHIVRFDGSPEHKLIAALLIGGRENATVPGDTLLGHLGNALTALEDAIAHAEPRTDDSERVTMWSTMRLEQAVKIASRVRAVRAELDRAIGRQGMIDTSARADNMPI